MKNLPVCTSLALLCLSTAWIAAPAQQMVHALSGTVVSVTPNIKMIEVSCDDGTTTDFQWSKKAGQAIEFDKSVSEDATAVEISAVKGSHVIVYFSGDGSPRTAVAVRKLEEAAVKETSGTVVKLDRHEHLLTIRSAARRRGQLSSRCEDRWETLLPE